MSAASDAQRTLAVVGAGYSGAVLAARILNAAPAGIWRVVLIERRSRFGRGLAYHNWDDNLLLNVPAGNMSAIAERPGDFVEFCRGIDPAFNSGSFVSRRLYGDYLEELLAAAERSGRARLERVTGEAVSVQRSATGAGFRVTLAAGASIPAGDVVLALGHFPPRTPPAVAALEGHPAYCGNPWDLDALDHVEPGGSVAILGAGHTAVDVVFRLTSGSDRRKVYLVSRRGLLPHGHRMNPQAPAAGPDYPAFLRGIPGTLLAQVRAIRAEVRRAAARGTDWRDVLNSLRRHTPDIWARLPEQERRRFLDRIVPYWDIHRHRLAPAAYLRLRRMLQSGQVELLAGRVHAGAAPGGGIDLGVELRQGGPARRLRVDALVNCTGPNYDVTSLELPLLAGLRRAGLLTPDAMRIGMQVDERYRLIDRAGQPVPGLYYLGPMLKARFWEAIAVPELREHAARLASELLESGPPTA